MNNKTHFIVCVVLSGLVNVSCSAPESSQKHQIKETVHSIFEEGWNRGNIASFDETVADSVLFYYAGASRTLARDEMSQFIVRWREAFPDLRMVIEELLIEDDLAATRLTLSGTHEGVWAGAEPTGKQVTMALMMFFRFEEGMIVELWEVDDQLGFQQQLELIPE